MSEHNNHGRRTRYEYIKEYTRYQGPVRLAGGECRRTRPSADFIIFFVALPSAGTRSKRKYCDLIAPQLTFRFMYNVSIPSVYDATGT